MRSFGSWGTTWNAALVDEGSRSDPGLLSALMSAAEAEIPADVVRLPGPPSLRFLPMVRVPGWLGPHGDWAHEEVARAMGVEDPVTAWGLLGLWPVMRDG